MIEMVARSHTAATLGYSFLLCVFTYLLYVFTYSFTDELLRNIGLFSGLFYS